MYIEPNTKIRLIRGCRLSDDYLNTIRFTTDAEQTQYFMSLDGIMLDKYSFQRYDRGVLTVNVRIADLLNVDYMMFQNTDFVDKWFYAFVKKVEYVSNTVSRVYYQIDVLQSWWFNWQLDTCIIERETVENDFPGLHVLDEEVDLGAYVDKAGYALLDDLDLQIRIQTTYDTSITPSGGHWHQEHGLPGRDWGMFTGFNTVFFPYTEQGGRDAIDYLQSWQDSRFVSVTVVPANRASITEFSVGPTYTWDFGPPAVADGVELPNYGYTPLNNKLYCYPYREFVLTDLNGKNVSLRPEGFLNMNPKFKILCDLYGAVASLKVVPYYYGWTGIDFPVDNTDYSLTMLYDDNVGYATDIFKNGVALKSAFGALTGSLPGVMNSYTPSVEPKYITTNYAQTQFVGHKLESGVNAIKTVGGAASSVSPMPFISGGLNLANSLVNSATNRSGANFVDNSSSLGVRFYKQCPVLKINTIDSYHAKIIDTYFTMYGYKVNAIRIPNTRSRNRFNYLKTSECNLKNVSCPQDVAETVKSIFNNGLRIWQKPEYFLVYFGEDGTLIENGMA